MNLMKVTLYRYLIKEILPAFILGLLGFNFILLTGRILQLTELFVNKGIPLTYILTLLYYLLPSFLVLTIPMATLLSVLMAFNRLSNDNEITVLKASGVSLYQLTPPVLALSCLAFLATNLISLYALPSANEASRALLFKMASSKAHAGVRERVFNDDFEGLVLYVERVAPKNFKWENVFISDSRNATETYTILAREGEVLSDPQRLMVTLRLYQGSLHRLGDKPGAYQKVDFNTYDLRLDLKTGMKEKPDREKHPADMSLRELNRTIQMLRAKRADVKPQMVKVHEKFSIPFACVVFGIIAMPLGLHSRPGRVGKSIGIAWSTGVLLVYYLLTNAGMSLAERGVILLEVGMWAANALFLVFGIYLLYKTTNESQIFLVVWINRLIRFLKGNLDRFRSSRR